MGDEVPNELVTTVRRLVEEIAPRNEELAARAFHGLVTTYGRSSCGAALRHVAAPAPAEWVSANLGTSGGSD